MIHSTLQTENTAQRHSILFCKHIHPKFHSCTVHLDIIESFICPTDAQLDCSKNIKIYIKIYIRGAAICFGFLQP
jgi:hypothetical protein